MNPQRSNENATPTAAKMPLAASTDAIRISSSLPHHRRHLSHHHHHCSKRRHSPVGGNGNGHNRQLSASIPLPASHIRRTPSELQLADDVRRAEYEDVRMYARLVVGMQSRCAAMGYVHPLTRKSLRDIFMTKQADGEELEKDYQEHHAHEEDREKNDDRDFDEDGWGLSCDRNECSAFAAGGGRAPTTTLPALIKTPSDRSMTSVLSDAAPPRENDEDECVFSLEL